MRAHVAKFLGIIIILLVIFSACSDGSADKAETVFREGSAEPASPPQSASARKAAERGPDGILKNPGIPSVEFHKKFDTNFGRSTVYFDSILPGGPPKDGIPALSDPKFTEVETAARWIEDQEPVLLLRFNGFARVYPIQILMWHEIVNDTIDGVPIGVSYAPLSNTAIAYHRKNFDTVLNFSTTGRIRFSNPVMYDRETESWWQQATGAGIVGTYAGDQLELLPVALLPWKEVERNFTEAKVLSRDTGYDWPYGTNAYEGYDTSEGPFLYVGAELKPEYELFERLIVVRIDGETQAYSYARLHAEKVLEARLGGRGIVIFWQAGTASPVDAPAIAIGRDVGSAVAYFSEVNGRELSFYRAGGQIKDRETGSVWSLGGVALSGELKGRRLQSPLSFQHFGYSWYVFKDEY